MQAVPTLPMRLLHWIECPDERQQIRRIFEESGLASQISDADSQDSFEFSIGAGLFDLAVVDGGGHDDRVSVAIRAAQAARLPIVLMFEPADEVKAIAALAAGASDYVLKTPLQLRRLPAAISLCVRVAQNVTANASLDYLTPILRNVHDAVIATDTSLRVTLWNAAAENLYGWTAAEVEGRDIRKVVHCPLTEKDFRRIGADLEAGLTFRANLIHCARDGRPIAVELAWIALRDLHGKTNGYLTTVRDVTDRDQARASAWENEARLQLACRAAAEAIADFNLRTGEVWRSEGYQLLFGYRPEEMLPSMQWWSQHIHPDDLDRVWKVTSMLMYGADEFTTEYRFRRADGTYAYLLHRGFVLRDAEATPLRVMTTLIDITERKRTEQALSQSEKRYRLLAENATDFILRIDDVARILYASPAVKLVLGFGPDEVLGRLVYDFVHPDDLAELRESLAAGTRQPLTLIYRVRKSDGHHVWLESVVRTIVDPTLPDAHEVICISRDVTARRQAEDLVRIQQAELAHISRLTSMGEMASGIAHELNQPLAAISHYADACRETIRTNDYYADNLLAWTKKIADQAERAGDIIRRIKGFVQKTQPERRDVDAGHLLQEVLELLDPDAKLHDIQVQLDDLAALPVVRVDKVQIQQVLVNLLRNAFEAIDECHATDRTVIVRASSPEPTEVLISVVDRGTSVSAFDLERIFEPFFTTKPDGTGVGLAISRSIVEDHGGRLWAANNPDQGMTFWFTLPTAQQGTHDGKEASRVRRRRRSRAPRSAAVDVGNDAP